MFQDAAAQIGTPTASGPVLSTSTVRISDVDVPYIQARLKAAAKLLKTKPTPAPEDAPGVTADQKRQIVAARRMNLRRGFSNTSLQTLKNSGLVVSITAYPNKLFEWLGLYGTTRRYHPISVISYGTHGAVFKFVSHEDNKPSVAPVAVKITFGYSDTIPMPHNLGCDVVRTVSFAGKAVQVMELANRDATALRPEEFMPFVEWCNNTAICLYENNVACPDWKLGNVAVFNTDGKPTFRVIDVDGMFYADAGVLTPSATYTCVATTTTDLAELRRLHQINTAYAIVVSQILAHGGISRRVHDALESMWDYTMDNKNWSVADTIAVLQKEPTLTAVNATPNSSRIFELLNQVRQDVGILSDEYIRAVYNNVFKNSPHAWDTPIVPTAQTRPRGQNMFSPAGS